MGNCARISRNSTDPIIHALVKPSNPAAISPKSPPQKSKNNKNFQADLGVMNLMSHIGYTNNCEYQGEFSKTKQRHGQGTLKWPDGTFYSGSWVDDRASGKGKLIFSNGDSYVGEFVENRFEGFGTYLNAKGVAYEGEWHNNLQNGLGIETFSDGTCFEGAYLNGLKNGTGKITFSDGSVYEGNFVENNIEGFGKLIWPKSENKIYEGEWLNNVMEGRGKMTWLSNGKVYDGFYCDDKKHGLGCFSWGTGEKWVGYWKDGIRHGKGILIDKEYKILEKGDWTMGKKIVDYDPENEKLEGFEEIFAFAEGNS